METRDIMTTPVITVEPNTTLHEVVNLLLTHRIGGVPVVEHGQVVGVVGKGDLLHRHEIGTDGEADQRTWWQRLTQSDPAPAAYVRSHGVHVRDVMSRDVVSVEEGATLSEVAALFEDRRIRRLPVLRTGQLIGLVTRADLIRALASTEGSPLAQHLAPSDEAIRLRLTEELGRQSWWSDNWSNVLVQDGVVRYVGLVHSEADRQAARIAAENIPGVRGIEDRRILQEEWQPML